MDHDYTRAQTLAQTGTIGFVADDPELARSCADEALALVDGRGFHSLELLSRIFLGWARASLGEVDEGVLDVEKGLSLADTSGSAVGLPVLYVAAAHVYRMARQRERADELLDRATTLYERTGDKVYHPLACFARARVLLEIGDGAPAEVERLLLEAVESAAAHDNVQWELIISTHLARLAPRTGKLREAQDRLAGHYARLTEGLDRGPAREAKAALDELAALLGA